MLRKYSSLSVILIIVLVLAVALSGCKAATPAVDTSKAPIKLGFLTDLTGPVALSGVPQTESGQDWWEYYNAQGGIKGHPVEMIVVDTRYDNNLAVSGMEKLVNYDKVHWVSAVAANLMPPLAPLANKYKVCTAGPSEMTVLLPFSPQSYVFGNGGTYADYYRSSLYWIKDNWKKADAPRIGILGLDAAFSKSTIKAVKWMLDNELKWPIVAEEWMTLASTSAASQVTNLKNAKCDYIIMCSTGVPQVVFLGTARSQGLTESTVLLDTFLSSIPFFRKSAPKSMDNIINHIPVAIYPQMADDTPILKTIVDIHKKKRPDVEFDWTRVAAYAGNIGFIDIFEQAIDKFGYDKLTGENIKWICENKMTGKTSQGLGAPTAWSPTSHVGGHDCNIVKTTPGMGVEVLSKWYKMPPWPKEAEDPNFWKQ